MQDRKTVSTHAIQGLKLGLTKSPQSKRNEIEAGLDAAAIGDFRVWFPAMSRSST